MGENVYGGEREFGFDDDDEEIDILTEVMDTLELNMRLETVDGLQELRDVEEEMEETLNGVKETLDEDKRFGALMQRYKVWRPEVENLLHDKRRELQRRHLPQR